MARHAPVTAVAKMMDLGESTVRRYDIEVLKLDLPAPTLDGLRVLIIDEKAIRKGHGYVTLVLNGETGELLHMAEGKMPSLESFFEKLTEAQKACVEAVCIVRAGAYQNIVGEQVPKATVVYDRLHLHLNLNAAIDKVRRQKWRQAKAEEKAVLKKSRFILPANGENLDDRGSVRPRDQCEHHHRLLLERAVPGGTHLPLSRLCEENIVAVVQHGCRKRPITISEPSKRVPKKGGQDRGFL